MCFCEREKKKTGTSLFQYPAIHHKRSELRHLHNILTHTYKEMWNTEKEINCRKFYNMSTTLYRPFNWICVKLTTFLHYSKKMWVVLDHTKVATMMLGCWWWFWEFRVGSFWVNWNLEIPCFALQDQVIHLSFVMVFQTNIGLDQPDRGTDFPDD